jgi:hypothetical protein
MGGNRGDCEETLSPTEGASQEEMAGEEAVGSVSPGEGFDAWQRLAETAPEGKSILPPPEPCRTCYKLYGF